MKQEYQVKNCSQAFQLKNELKNSPYKLYSPTYPHLRDLYPQISINAYDLYIEMLKYPTKTKGGYFTVAENYWRKTCSFTHRAFLNARAELQTHEAIKTSQHGFNHPPTYRLRAWLHEVKSYLMIPLPVVDYLGALLEHKLLNRPTRYLYFHLYGVAFKADFPESIFLDVADVAKSLGHPPRTLRGLTAKLKALDLLQVKAAKTCHSPSEFFISVPAVKYPARENRAEIQIATNSHQSSAMAAIKARLGI